MRPARLSFVIFLSLVLAGSACGGESKTPANTASSRPPSTSPSDNSSTRGFASYSNSTYGFTLQYPNGWEKQEGALGSAVVLLSPAQEDSDDFRENVNVLLQKLPDKMTLDEYTRLSLDQAPTLIAGFELLDQGSTRLGGLPAHRVHYRGEQGTFRLELEQVWTVLGGQAFIITYTAERDRYEIDLRTARTIFASVRLL